METSNSSCFQIFVVALIAFVKILPLPVTYQRMSDTNLTQVDTGLIPQASLDDQTSELQGLGLSVFNQDEFEQGVCLHVCPSDCFSLSLSLSLSVCAVSYTHLTLPTS